MAGMTLAVYMYFETHMGHGAASVLAFTTLVVAQWANAIEMRSNFQSAFRRLSVANWPFIICLIVAIGLQVAVLFTPLGAILHVTEVPLKELAIVAPIAFVVPILAVELHKLTVAVRGKKK